MTTMRAVGWLLLGVALGVLVWYATHSEELSDIQPFIGY